MIETRYGNVLDVEQGMIVHGCNCQGVMGGGIALQVKNRFPDAFHVYDKVHRSRGLKLGDLSWAEVAPNKFIINALTQDKFGGAGTRYVSYDAVADVFTEIGKMARTIKTNRKVDLPVLFPLIGAGLGGGRWEIIAAIIDVVIPDTVTKVLYKVDPDAL